MLSTLERTFGFYPISIATSMAFEGITRVGEYRDRPGEPEIEKIPALWINIRTLARNAIGAFNKDQIDQLTGPLVKETILTDLNGILNIMHEYPNVELNFYICEYHDLDRDWPDVRFKKSETAKQRQHEALERGMVTALREELDGHLLVFNWKLSGKKRTVLLTHMPMDLLSYYEFPDLELLESHTGVIKTRRHWFTKLNIDKELTVIPFNRATLCIFGDKVMILPQDLKARRRLIDIGKKRGWNPMTTTSKMISDVQLEYEPFLVEFLRRYKQ